MNRSLNAIILILMLTFKVSRLLGAMDKRGEVVEELEEVVKLYRERIVEEKAVEDSVEELEKGVVKLNRERLKLIEDETEDVTEESEVERLKERLTNYTSYS